MKYNIYIYICIYLLITFGTQHYAMAGLKTCLAVHSQDPTAEYLLNCKIGTSPVACSNNLSAVRLETTKVCFPLFLSLFFLFR